MKKYVTLALLAALCSCNDRIETPTKNAEVALGLTGSTISLAPTRSGTTQNLKDGTQVGVYVLQTSGTATTFTTTTYQNGLYQVTGTEGAFVSTSPFILYDGFKYSAYAYAPRLATVAQGATALPFSHGTDVLYAPASEVSMSSTAATAALSFTHQMSQISFTLVSGIGSPDLTNAELTVSGFAASCTMNLADGSITPVSGAGATITQIATPTCFVPGALSLSVSVKSVDGKTYSRTVSRTFAAGSSYSYTLTLNKTEAQLGVTGTVVDWVTVPSGNVDLEDFK